MASIGTQNIQAHSGNLLALEFEGKRFGTIQSMSVNDDYGPEPVSGIGSPIVQEYVASVARHSISVQHAVLRKGSMRQEGIIPENACDRMKGLEFDIVIYEKAPTGCDGGMTRVRTYRHCSMASGSINIQAHRVVMTDATFNARDVEGTGL